MQLKSSDKANIDLSSIRHMINAAEPVDVANIDTFQAVFQHYGLQEGVIFPTYGLAEHTVYVTSNGRQRLTVDKRRMETEGVIREVDKIMLWAHTDAESGAVSHPI